MSNESCLVVFLTAVETRKSLLSSGVLPGMPPVNMKNWKGL